MKKLLLLGAVLVVGTISMADVIVNLGGSTSNTGLSGTGYLPITSTGEVINVANQTYLKIVPTSNIGPDGSSLLFDFGQMKANDEKTVIGQFTAQVIKNTNSGNNAATEVPLELKGKLTVGFDKGNGDGAAKENTQIESEILIAKEGTGSTGGAATKVGKIKYTLTGNFQGKDLYIGNVQADATINGQSDTSGSEGEGAVTGVFIDRTQKVAVMISGIIPSPQVP